MLEAGDATVKKPCTRGADPSDGASSSSAGPLRGGIRNRIGKSESTTEVDASNVDKPLNQKMKEKWGKGKVSAKDVAEVFDAASQQGAVGVPKLSSMNHPQNLHRSLVAAFGHPKGAPDFSGHLYL